MKVKPPREKGSSFFSSKKFLTILIGLFIIMIMVLSVLDLWRGSDGTSKYGNTEFTQDNSGWIGYVGSNPVRLTYDPQELENVSLVDFSSFNSVQKIYLSTDDPLLMYRSMDYFRNHVPLTPQQFYSCIPEASNVTECSDWPLKDCSDADNSVGVIIFKNSDEVKTYSFSSTCLVIEGNNDNLPKVFDRAMLKMLGA
ncbi:MAG: hypothetical protein V1645_03965 [archaeon]